MEHLVQTLKAVQAQHETAFANFAQHWMSKTQILSKSEWEEVPWQAVYIKAPTIDAIRETTHAAVQDRPDLSQKESMFTNELSSSEKHLQNLDAGRPDHGHAKSWYLMVCQWKCLILQS